MNLWDLGAARVPSLPFVTRCAVPGALDAVTTVRRDAEVDPRAAGVAPAAVAAIWGAVERLYASGVQPAIQLCVRRRGQVLLDRAIGHARGNGPADPPDAERVLVTPDTPFVLFSASKAVTAMLVHRLDEQDRLRLDDPVCEYVPEFAAHGKEPITLRHLLTHRAGIPYTPPEAIDLDLLGDHGRILRILCDTRPAWRPGRTLAYHSVTGGFVLAEVIRRVCGRDIRAVLDAEIRRPLGFRWMSYGVDREDVGTVAVNYFTGAPVPPPASTLIRRAVGMDFHTLAEASNDPRFLLGVVPSGNVVASADELCRFYQLLLDGGTLGGVRVFDARTVRRATAEQSYGELDRTLVLPLRYGTGFLLGARWLSPFGPDTEHAFGHLGFINIVSWADPARDLAAALLTSGKPFASPHLYHLYDVLRQIGLACGTG